MFTPFTSRPPRGVWSPGTEARLHSRRFLVSSSHFPHSKHSKGERSCPHNPSSSQTNHPPDRPRKRKHPRARSLITLTTHTLSSTGTRSAQKTSLTLRLPWSIFTVNHEAYPHSHHRRRGCRGSVSPPLLSRSLLVLTHLIQRQSSGSTGSSDL